MGFEIMKDRRITARVPLKAKCHAVCVSADTSSNGNGTKCSGWTSDASLGGIQLRSRKALPLHADIEVEVHCTHPIEEFTLRGQVGWVRREGATMNEIGVFLHGTDRNDLVAWRRMLVRRGLNG